MSDQSTTATQLRSRLFRPIPFMQARVDTTALDAFALPIALAQHCVDITNRTRLRRRERCEVARELAAHCADALEAGRDEADILATMGEPKPVAKLLRKGMLRKRHPIDQAVRFSAKATGVTVAGLAIFYTAWSIRFYAGEPNINTSYIAQLNERPQSIPQDQRAWPLYLEALLTLRQAKLDLDENVLVPKAEAELNAALKTDPNATRRDTGIDDPFLPPEHPDYDDIVSLYEQHADKLKLIHEGAAKPGFGFEYSFDTIEYDRENHATAFVFKPHSDDPAEQPPLIDLLLPHLGSLRSIARDLGFAALHAARTGDSQAALANIIALNQLTRQATDEPFLIGYLVGIAIGSLTDEVTIRTIHHNPDLYSPKQLATLAHSLASREQSQIANAFASETYWFNDFLQRAYTDNGNGNGRLTEDAFFTMGDNPFNISKNDYEASIFPAVALPALALITADRQSLKDEYDLYFHRARAAAQLETPNMVRAILELEQEQERKSRLYQTSYWPLGIILPAIARATTVDRLAQTKSDATLAIVAAAAHRAQTGEWPETLEQLTPKLLPRLPDDPFNPGYSLIYKLTESGPLLYSVGENATDDNAADRPRHPNRRFHRARPDLMKRYNENHADKEPGDFVLYPPYDND